MSINKIYATKLSAIKAESGSAGVGFVQINNGNGAKDVTHTPRGTAKCKQYENFHLYAWARTRWGSMCEGVCVCPSVCESLWSHWGFAFFLATSLETFVKKSQFDGELCLSTLKKGIKLLII